MPRWPNKNKNDKTGPPASLPSEGFPEHRLFLIRSLERNDVDMAALVQLNKTLRKAKEKILQTCGELVLLDLGCGRLTLINDELHEVSSTTDTGEVADEKTPHHLTPAQKEACVDFLLRMKLRRKLSNRLIRRLTRVATAMDGNNVAPPAPPKYGDLRLHVDEDVVDARVEEWKQREAAKKRIEAALKGDETVYAAHEDDAIAEDDPPTTAVAESADSPKKVEDADTEEAKSQDVSPPADSKKPVSEDGPKPMDIDSPASGKEEKPDAEKVDATPEKVKEESPKTAEAKPVPPTLESDYALLMEYDDAYRKVWDAETNTFKFFIPTEEKDAEPDYTDIKNGAGIGAVNRGMTLPDREAEYKRWQAGLLAKIPDQPTLEELGLKNRVFCLEERRKRCLEEVDASGDEGESPTKKTKGENGDGQTTTKESGQANDGPDTKDGNGEDKEDTKKAAKVEVLGDPLKPKRPISFAGTPSFHEQDLARTRLIHRDMVANLKSERGKKDLAVATTHYNKALSESVQGLQHQQQIQHNLTFVIAKGREEVGKANAEYAVVVEKAKQLWIAEKTAHDATRLKALLPSKSGKSAEGSPMIHSYLRHNANDGVITAVGKCVADIIDGSLAEAPAVPKFKDFAPPPRPIINDKGENAAQRQHRIETDYRTQYNILTTRITKSEEERAKAWRMMMKAKADLELYHEAVVHGRRQNVLVHQNNFASFPLPPLRGGVSSLTMPRELTRQSVQMASYRPPTNAPVSTNTSKYSAEKVRQRKSADGTVAPVSEPKKTEDGLYQRPAGRTRKGMRWDPVAGVWVPQSQS